jgi:hypothetical protein
MKNALYISGVIVLTLIIFLFLSCTEKPTAPLVATIPVTEISFTTASSGGSVTNEGEATITERGVCWSTIADPTIANTKTSEKGGFGAFTSEITLLSANTVYFVRAYATNEAGTGYGKQVTFTTKKSEAATLTTAAITLITQTSAVSGGNISGDNGASVTARGICWSITAGPTIESGTKTTDGTGTGAFTSNITKLNPNTLYYVRAYATSSAGIGYGNQLTFTTSEITVPALTTTTITSITQVSAVSGGNITIENGGPVIARGICWSITTGPAIESGTKTTDGTGRGAFASSITQLIPNTLYYVRAYATNAAGTNYGNELTFTTRPGATAALSTTAITSITFSSAISGGNITNDSGGPVTVRGVCWNTLSGPTISLSSKTTDGSGGGVFASIITQLVPNTLYYVRAYATNNAGTSYGNELIFTTYAFAAPTLTTAAITSITQISALSGGNIVSENGVPVTSRGVCWSTISEPTIALSTKTTDGAGPGIFVSNISQLTSNTFYYVRAYATNAAGTAYGNQVSFRTNQIGTATLTTTEVTSITPTGAVSGGNISSDNGLPVTARGICWSTATGPTTDLSTKTTDGTGTGVFESSITGLTAGRIYYVRAYATNSAGTDYGNQVCFFISSGGGTGTVYNGHFYYLSSKDLSWTEAQTYCESFGGHLAIINDAAENNFAWNLCNHEGFNFGLSDLEQEQVWKWVDGTLCRKVEGNIITDYGYNNWRIGEPNSCGGLDINGICIDESYAVFNDDGTWNDVSGFGRFIIEWEFIPDIVVLNRLLIE